ncbi:MAG: M23 family metallopeptidase [Rhodothermales bacterium]
MIAILTLLLTTYGTGDVLPPKDTECFDQTFCIETLERDGTITLEASLLVSWDITMSVHLELVNLRSTESMPLVRTVSADRKAPLVELQVDNPDEPWSYSFNFSWVTGSATAVHAASVTYALPFERGTSWLVGQGYNGQATHRGKYALDWAMPEGTAVRAARGGMVVSVEADFRTGGLDDELKGQANHVSIQHDDGTIGTYVHLRHGGVEVEEGMHVREGDLLGWSGGTGYASGPHLHFEVYTVNDDLTRTTIPVEFRTRGRSAEMLIEGRTYGH